MKDSPYMPFPKDRHLAARLVLLKNAADDNECSENTLRNNAKARRIPAYQQCHGAPIYVLPEEVEEFLRARLDIASKHNPKSCPVVFADAHSPNEPQLKSRTDFPVLEEESLRGAIGDLGIGITLRSLNHCHPAEIGLVANTLIEVGRQLLDLIPPQSTNINH